MLILASPGWAYTVTDFAVDPAHATLGDPHQVASPPFNNFQLTIFGSFNVNKCYQVSIKREGSGSCGSANSSGTDICAIWISPTTSSDWGSDWLTSAGTSQLAPGQYAWWEVYADTYDIAVADCFGNELEVYFVEVYADTAVEVYPTYIAAP